MIDVCGTASVFLGAGAAATVSAEERKPIVEQLGAGGRRRDHQ
jgi:hypothetical protein